jgi:hypothetical protein
MKLSKRLGSRGGDTKCGKYQELIPQVQSRHPFTRQFNTTPKVSETPDHRTYFDQGVLC